MDEVVLDIEEIHLGQVLGGVGGPLLVEGVDDG